MEAVHENSGGTIVHVSRIRGGLVSQETEVIMVLTGVTTYYYEI